MPATRGAGAPAKNAGRRVWRLGAGSRKAYDWLLHGQGVLFVVSVAGAQSGGNSRVVEGPSQEKTDSPALPDPAIYFLGSMTRNIRHRLNESFPGFENNFCQE